MIKIAGLGAIMKVKQQLTSGFVIDCSFLLQEIVAAFKYYESQKHFGKVCLDV
jgi:ABC-type protease/lipase transport system fused ATPase/permease subunit